MIEAAYKVGGKVLMLEHTKNGLRHGIQSDWNIETELLVSERPYHMGLLHGVVRAWHFNGLLSSEAVYFNGSKSGLHREYHGNGLLMCESLWVNGRQLGETRIWSLTGEQYKGQPAKKVEGSLYGRNRSNSMDEPNSVLFTTLRQQKEICFQMPIFDVQRHTPYENAISALVANKMKRWSEEQVGMEEMRDRLLGVDGTNDAVAS